MVYSDDELVSRVNSHRRSAGAALLALGALAAGAWWWTAPATVRREPHLNVLLITVDTLRADAVGAYGRPGRSTPSIDRLAHGGVRFADAHAHNVVTLPSHANILTGRLPPDHGVRDNAGFRLPAGVETLATLLKDRGYRTAAFVSAFPLDSWFGLARGFDVYDDRFAEAGRHPAFLIQERPGDRTVTVARRWLEAAGRAPWFCWIHVYEPHYPYEPQEPFASRWPGDPYLGEVAAADAVLAPLLEPILTAGADGRTLVALTSDHGESLGEHGEATHGIFAYESALRVPLVFYQPRLFRPRVVAAPAGHLDILPTVLDALGMAAPPGLSGRSLLSVMAGADDAAAPVLYFEALSGSLNRGWAPLVGIIHDGLKYVDLPLPELYDLRADPGEARNLAHSAPARLAGLRARLEAYRSSEPAQARHREPVDVRERLRSLGYASGGHTRRLNYTEEDDPKRLIPLDALLQDVVGRYLAGDLSGALARSRELVRRRPGMALSWMQLAQLERQGGNLDAAVEALERAVALSPGDTEALALLGACLTEAGRARDAVDLLAPHAKGEDADPDLLTALALALARLGRIQQALSTLARLRAQDPTSAKVLVHVGTVHLTAGDRAAARGAFEEAIRLNPEAARAHSSLGVLAVEDGQVDRAVEHWTAATSLDPREYESILGLGLALGRSGRMAAARPCVEFFAANAPPLRYAREIERARAWLTHAR